MAIIKTIPEIDTFGKGYKKEITLDDGKKYVIQTKPEIDTFGKGYKKEIVESNTHYDLLTFLGIFITLAITSTIFIGGAFLFFKMIGY